MPTKYSAFRKFAKDVTVTPISLAARAVHLRLRCFWTFLLILFLGLSVYQSADLLNTYFKYEKIAVISVTIRNFKF